LMNLPRRRPQLQPVPPLEPLPQGKRIMRITLKTPVNLFLIYTLRRREDLTI
jgi:hypothetical protein